MTASDEEGSLDKNLNKKSYYRAGEESESRGLHEGSARLEGPPSHHQPFSPSISSGQWADAYDLLSDSSLSDVPSDLSDWEFDGDTVRLVSPATKTQRRLRRQGLPASYAAGPFSDIRISPPPTERRVKRASGPTRSPFFPKKRAAPVSALPFPPLSAKSFGLVQEKLAHHPFRLLLATIFLNKTRGEVSMPVFYRVMERYPSVEALALAQKEDISSMIHHLGFQNARAVKSIELAKTWLTNPPTRSKRYRRLNYPVKGDGKDVPIGTAIDDSDARIAWEVSHLPGCGPYAMDSWRIFCRDELRGLASSWNGEGATEADFEPEWKRVLPLDKELRAYLRWMWLKEGWMWDQETGERTRADEQTMAVARRGGVAREDEGGWVLEPGSYGDIEEGERAQGNLHRPEATP